MWIDEAQKNKEEKQNRIVTYLIYHRRDVFVIFKKNDGITKKLILNVKRP
jgi:hypothetical protein